jgi:hypothetical protein
MRLKPLILGALICVTVTSVRAQQQVTLLANLLDPTTNAAPETIDVADVRVTEDGATGKTIRVEVINRVVKLQLMVDNGAGIGPENIGELRKGVRGLLEALPPGIETTVVTTAPQPRFLVRATTSREELLRGVDRLSPDTGTGRFVEGLGEAAQRAQKEKEGTFTVFIAAGTSSGDGNVQERDVKDVFQRLQGRPAIVHVLLFSGGSARSATGGAIQTDVGLAVTKMTGGRYENINSISRYITLMPELGAEVAKQLAGQTRQFRIIAQRPDGKSGDFGRLGLGVAGKTVQSVSVESR